MPTRPLGACRHRSCPSRATHGGYCATHYQPRERPADERPSAAQRGYDAKWRRIRAAYLKKHPTCVACGEQATEVDHIKALRDGGTNEWANLQAMCKTHHSQKTNRENGGGWRR